MTPLLAVRLEVCAALTVLLGLIWLLRGGRAGLKACAAVGLAVLITGLAVGRGWMICGGLVIFAVVAWAWRSA